MYVYLMVKEKCRICERIFYMSKSDDALRKHLEDLHKFYHEPTKFYCFSRAIEKRLYKCLRKEEMKALYGGVWEMISKSCQTCRAGIDNILSVETWMPDHCPLPRWHSTIILSVSIHHHGRVKTATNIRHHGRVHSSTTTSIHRSHPGHIRRHHTSLISIEIYFRVLGHPNS